MSHMGLDGFCVLSMEMDVIKGNSEWNCIEDESAEHLLSPGICDAYRDPELFPRIGDEYQVQIPAHMTECAYGLLVESPAYAIISSATYHDILVGLPVSLMWISEEVENSKHEPQDYPRGLTNNSTINKSAKPESIRETNIVPEIDLKAEVELMDVTANDDIEVGESAKLCFPPEISNEMLCDLGGKDYCLVPGSVGNPWSDAEEDSFLLGLYIFGKNLVQVKNFVESKKMGDILSLYYGKFYRSDRYHKWSECRKVRSRKCVYGQRIFTGSRHHEMLSRLLPQLSEERRSILLEAAKAFGEGKTLLEEYVFTLKVMVGLHALVEAVGIGKGKQDLTGMTTEPLKSIQVAPVRPEIPIGKACSTLTPVEIINYLTGGYRLSKARSNDLFWEAVWPLLLARGWHSEQPDDHGFAAASRHSLVFLIPGIEKFSRRKLVKGDHYFDSVSDVLNKVASDPTLLDLDIGEDKGDGSKEETAWSNKTNLNQGNFPSQQRHCYLKPRTPSRTSNAMMFTVVDTSLANGEIKKVRELRSLPVGLSMCTSRSDSEDSDDDSLKESAEESDSSENLCPDMNGTTTKKSTKNDMGKGVFSDREDVEDNASKQSFHINSLGFAKVHEKIPKDQKADRCNGTQTSKRIKHQATRRDILCDRKVLGPVTKRQRLISYDHTKTSCGTIDRHGSKLDKPGCAGEGDIRDDFLSRVDPLVERLSATCSRGSPDISNECTLSSNSDDDDHPHEKHQTRALIDLNIPIPQDAETEPLMMEVTEVKDDPASRQTKDFGMLKVSTSAGDSTPQQSPNMNSRRHSTRNRPLTTKALEALACGFLSIKQKRKSRDVFSLDNQMSRPSRCARSKMRITENFQAEMTDFEGDERRNGGCKSNDDMVSEVQI
ncbi:PROTEIN putative-RELATED [Salix koriyanagi]|uniref:PROTEIN putative-RELATED n=1 Tax=Salix koriyanagi TaxID=2511006 RepID=A0A9Q0WMJ5_9ROSI|nr:PROTEIN putative-RELATED [Salix koriyanagi]